MEKNKAMDKKLMNENSIYEVTKAERELRQKVKELEHKVEELEGLISAYENQVDLDAMLIMEIGVKSNQKDLEEYARKRLGEKKSIVHKMSLGIKLSDEEKGRIIEILNNED